MKTKNRAPFISVVALALPLGLSGCGKPPGNDSAKPDPVITAKLDAIRQAGQPVTLAELNAWYPEPPAGENAAPLYSEAFAALSRGDPNSPSYLAKNQAARALLRQAAGKSQCRYPVDQSKGASAAFSRLSNLKACANVLRQQAADNAAKGRLELAAQDVIDGLRLARSLAQEPLLISQLVRISCDRAAEFALEGAVGLKAFPDEQLVRLQAALREEEETVGSSLARSFAGERCGVTSLIQMPLADYEKLSAGAGPVLALGAGAGTNLPLGSPAEFDRYRQGPAFKADCNLCLDYFSNCLAVASAPFPACLEVAAQWAPEAEAQISAAKTKGYRISATTLPALDRTLEPAADCVGALRAAQAALAVERYRLATSSTLPDSLAQLAPKYLPAVPLDPYDGKPLRYKKLSPKGYVVYSIGRNRQDDGGTPRPAGGKADGPYDLTFIVRR